MENQNKTSENSFDPNNQITFNEPPIDPNSIKPVFSFIESEEPAENVNDLNKVSTNKDPLWKKTIIPIAILLLLAIAAAAAFAYSANQNSKPIPLTDILPADPNLVLLATINPNSQQFNLLQTNLKKFPGYSENVSAMLDEKLKLFNFDFEKELIPAIGDKAYFVINDLSPFIKNTSNNIGTGFDYTTEQKKDSFEKTISEVNFISAVEIKDQKKALELFKKLQADSNFNISNSAYKGYPYSQIEYKKVSDEQKKKFFSTIAGGNLIIASSENELKAALDKADSHKFSFAKKTKMSSLSDNSELKSIFDYFRSSVNNDQILSTYVKIKTDQLTENSQSQYIQYPSNIIYGFDIRVNENGIGFNVASNVFNFKSIKNADLANGLASKLPQQADGKWADIFSEAANIKDLYYDVKQNYLTEKGRESLKEITDGIDSKLNINFESDLINQINGNVGLTIFTKENVQPDVAFVVPVSDSEKMATTIQKMIDGAKNNVLQTQFIGPANASRQQALQKKLDSMFKTTVIETPEGKIYTLDLQGSPIPFNYAIEKNTLVISTSSSTIQSILQTINTTGSQNTLAKNALFVRAQQNSQSQGYSQSFIVTQGIINIFSFFEKQFITSMNADTKDDIQESDSIIAFSSIFKTIKSLHTINSVNGQFLQYSAFIEIKELPQPEKEKAARAIKNLKNKSEDNNGAKFINDLPNKKAAQ